MKKIIFLIALFLFLIPGFLYSQTDEPQIGDNTIIVKNSQVSSFNDLKKFFIINGYSIKNEDPDINSLYTEYKSFEGSMIAIEPELSINAIIEDYRITLYANYRFKGSNALGGEEYSGRADYQKRKNVGRRLAFDQLLLLTQKMEGDIYFLKK